LLKKSGGDPIQGGGEDKAKNNLGLPKKALRLAKGTKKLLGEKKTNSRRKRLIRRAPRTWRVSVSGGGQKQRKRKGGIAIVKEGGFHISWLGLQRLKKSGPPERKKQFPGDDRFAFTEKKQKKKKKENTLETRVPDR